MPSSNFFFLNPAVAPLRISYATGPSSIMPRAPENVFPFAEASEAPAPPPASLGLASLQILCERASGPQAVPLTASAAPKSVLSGVSTRSVGVTFGINSGESLAAEELSMYLSPSRVLRGLAPEAGIDDPLRDSSVLLGEKNLGTEEGHGLGMDEEQVTFSGDGARESNEGLLREGSGTETASSLVPYLADTMERLEEKDSFVPTSSQGGYLASSTVKRKSPPEFNSSRVELGGLFSGRGIAVARNLMASVGISRAGERSLANLHTPPDTTLPSSWFCLATPLAPPAASGSATGNRTPVSRETPDHQLPQVALFEYNGDSASICVGSVSYGQRVCVTHPGMCTFKHIPKLHTKLAAGFYIRPAVVREGASIYLSPTVSSATTSASLGFFSIP